MDLSYFVGKICTILTNPTNRFFDDDQHANVFVGLVTSIDKYGIWIRQLPSNRKTLLCFPIVGIVEERVETIEEEEEVPVPAGDFIPLEELKRIDR